MKEDQLRSDGAVDEREIKSKTWIVTLTNFWLFDA